MTSDPRPDLVDKTALDQVRGNISPAVVAELYEQFITELKNHGMLDETGATVPPDRLSRRAHSLKSTCGTFGLARLAWLARHPPVLTMLYLPVPLLYEPPETGAPPGRPAQWQSHGQCHVQPRLQSLLFQRVVFP